MVTFAEWQHDDSAGVVTTDEVSERQQQSAQNQPGTARTAAETNDKVAISRRPFRLLLLRIDIKS